MVGGITELFCSTKTNFLHLRFGVNWRNNECIDDDSAKLFRELKNDGSYIDKFLKSNKELSLFKLHQFKSNKILVNVKDLYNTDISYCIIRKDKQQSLLLTRAKSAKEISSCGYTKDGGSYVPLIVSFSSSFSILNSI